MPAIQPGFIPLATLPRVLRERYEADPPPYRQVRRLILNGLIDAEPVPSNRLLVHEGDLPRIAGLLGLAEPST